MQALGSLSSRPRLAARSHHHLRQRNVLAKATASELQKEYGIGTYVKFSENKEGLTKVALKHDSGHSAEIYTFGACITSWTQATGSEILYCRPDAVFDGSKPISGGIPHCFPQFGPGEMQQHGFARNVTWEVASTSADLQPDERDPCVELVLRPSDYTKEMFPYDFKLVYSVTLHGSQLQTEYRVMNEGDKPFEFTAALHSYFEVLGIDVATVSGLKGLKYLDKSDDPKNPAEKTEEREKVTFGESLVDSVYVDASDYVELDVGTGAAVSITSTGWSDCVVWNPYTTMEACYKEFCCVENAKITPVTVQPGKDWRATTVMDVVDRPPEEAA